MIVNNSIYVDGKWAASPETVEETTELQRTLHGMAWLGLYEPSEPEFERVAREFHIHELAVEDAVQAHQRPKIERYGSLVFVVLRTAHYVDPSEIIDFGEIHLFIGADFVITVRHGAWPDLQQVRQRLESTPELLALGPAAVLYGVMDQVADEYRSVVNDLEHDIDEIEIEVFGGEPDVSKRTYSLAREVIGFQRAVDPLIGMLSAIRADRTGMTIDPNLNEYFRDVQDHVVQMQEQVQAYRDILQNVLSVNLAIVGLQQNEDIQRLSEIAIKQNDEVKKISAWAAILFAPTLVGTIYGMNFDSMPELHWGFGYPLALVMMLSVSIVLWFVFRRKGWLSSE
ncbi:MAG: magnesium and cobalt transport protein CorA [Thermomicrobiales bacterium]|nr:magnesium and cobalt transport protein CorA [Thermomicrobiales bacterium]MCO5220373.1 magnesium and cobalt transport protein CorA [Thermomicrobiales bacterium]